MISEDDVLTVEEASNILKVSRKTLYNLMKRGEIHAVKVGKRWRILRISLERYLFGKGKDGII